MNKTTLVKLLSALVALAAISVSAVEFYGLRHYKEATVLGPSVTVVERLSTYEPSLAGTANDCNVYILDSGRPGGTLLLLGGTHPEEPAGPITAEILIEGATVNQGKLIIVTRANRSASLYTRNGEAYPSYFHIDTQWGTKKWRMGDRNASPLDSWPDPEVYVHYPSRQMLAYMDIRNLNRAWPGRKNGLLVERTTYAFMELIKRRAVDLVIDLHEAELEYPVENTIVTHENGQELAVMASMMLTGGYFPVPMGVEYSPKALHGLSHREIGDNSDAVSILFEVAEPFLDRIRGVTDEKLLMEGRDEFVMKAGEAKLLYAPMDEHGWPIEVRVARHLTTIKVCLDLFSMSAPDKGIDVSGIPEYQEIVDKKLGMFFTDPASVAPERVAYD